MGALCSKTGSVDFASIFLAILTTVLFSVECLFLATISEESISVSDGIIIWNSAPIDPGLNFNTETGAYVAPLDGYYQ